MMKTMMNDKMILFLLFMIVSYVITLDINSDSNTNTNTNILFIYNSIEEDCDDGPNINKRIAPALSQAIFTQKVLNYIIITIINIS